MFVLIKGIKWPKTNFSTHDEKERNYANGYNQIYISLPFLRDAII